MSTVTEAPEARTNLSANIEKMLADQGKSAYWLMRQIGMTEGSFYPIIRGEVIPSVLIAKRISEALGVTLDSLMESAKNGRKTSNFKKSKKSD